MNSEEAMRALGDLAATFPHQKIPDTERTIWLGHLTSRQHPISVAEFDAVLDHFRKIGGTPTAPFRNARPSVAAFHGVLRKRRADQRREDDRRRQHEPVITPPDHEVIVKAHLDTIRAQVPAVAGPRRNRA